MTSQSSSSSSSSRYRQQPPLCGFFPTFTFFSSSSLFTCLRLLSLGRSSYCVAVQRTFKAQQANSNGAAVWADPNARQTIYTCPDCQELAQSSS